MVKDTLPTSPSAIPATIVSFFFTMFQEIDDAHILKTT
jgi:hypothetical protein